MISRMRVQHFKALRDVTVDLEPFTVLIGPNDTGKSSFLEALFAIAESSHRPLSKCFWSTWESRELVYKQFQDGLVNFEVSLGEESSVCYSLMLKFLESRDCRAIEEIINKEVWKDRLIETHLSYYRRNPGSIPQGLIDTLLNTFEHLQSPTLARWNIEDLASPSRLPTERRYPIDPSGYGLASCLAEMKMDDLDRNLELRDSFRELFPNYHDFRIKRVTTKAVERDDHFRRVLGSEGEGYALFLISKDGLEIPAGQVSGGILFSLAFLTLAHLR